MSVMRVVTAREVARDIVRIWEYQRDGQYGGTVIVSDDYLRTISKALDGFNGKGIVDFVRDTYRLLGLEFDGAITCSECGEKCGAVVEFWDNGFSEEEIYICESCLERALGMLRDSP